MMILLILFKVWYSEALITEQEHYWFCVVT